ncbi:hypothetical protein HNP55_004474 [Paucibacter oligotrophus]|uniref:Uncharacterized protein n=1 Tax=Roseateles oligotrophus TaxID=1769250 RepID=A0A840LCN5_9BURK|nr:hypothetical protein [Roseateles oligotrophus]MBB4845920.1 hypothetical protein [Roseateles oligotrophus]
MPTQTEISRARKLLLLMPLIFLGGSCIGWFITLPYYKTDVRAYMVVGWLVILSSVFSPLFILGRCATLLGASWIYFGLLPILFIPIAPAISWLALWQRQSRLASERAEPRAQEIPSGQDV